MERKSGFGLVPVKREGCDFFYDPDGIREVFGSLKAYRRFEAIGKVKYLKWYLSTINHIRL